MRDRDLSLIGIGLYTVPDAAKLTRVAEPRIRRWLTGYKYRSGDHIAASPAVWHPQIPALDGVLSLGFLDLMEIRFVNAFLEARVSWPKIRLCAERARELFGQDHPFATRRFRTDGSTIFAEVMGAGGEKQFLDLAKSQMAFGRIIAPSLYEGIEFSAEDAPLRWWPVKNKWKVVLDPAISFGKPILAGTGIPTRTLAAAVRAEGDAAKVARLFDVPRSLVTASVAFEEQLSDRKLAA